jgi:hypothetical protein
MAADKSYSARAEAELKRLRGLFKEGAIAQEEEPTLRLQLANVLATLDLAAAIRGRNGGEDPES